MKTTKIKTSELTGAALNWAVATCEGAENLRENPHRFDRQLIIQLAGRTTFFKDLRFSTDWSQGGPIIERERIDVFSIANGKGWCAQSDARVFNGYGPTPLVAALRCYVASKLGDEVEIPTDLANSNN